MKRILLLIPPQKIRDVKQTGTVWLRISIGYLGAYLRNHGFNVKILDCKAEGLDMSQLKDKVSQYSPHFVGLSAFTEEILDVSKACTVIKKLDSKITTIVGGPHPSAIPSQTLEEFEDIDIAVSGEGEQTLLEIVQKEDLIELKDVNGIAFRQDGKIIVTPPRQLISHVDSIPEPAWDMFNLNHYRGRETFSHCEKTDKDILELPILGARGCPFQCNFCFKVYGKSLRLRDPSLVVREMEDNIKKYGATGFFFVEGTFGVKESWGLEFCDILMAKGLHKKINWDANVRVDISHKLLSKMKDAGCRAVYFGIESGDENILKQSGKNISLDQIKKTVYNAQMLGFRTGCYFIVGHPNETFQQAKKTAMLARELDSEIFNLGIMVPYPGTKIYDMALRGEGGYKLLSKDWGIYLKQEGGVLELDKIPLAKLKKFQSQAYVRYYLRLKKMFFILRFFPLSKIIKISRSLMKNV